MTFPTSRVHSLTCVCLGEKETEEAFSHHFKEQLSLYKHVSCISLVERVGREKIMADAFLHHIVLYNNPSVAYVAFDFHDYWYVTSW